MAAGRLRSPPAEPTACGLWLPDHLRTPDFPPDSMAPSECEGRARAVSYTHLRAHETSAHL
eukprot:5111893-Alexandrium_andersonii.AAC.1